MKEQSIKHILRSCVAWGIVGMFGMHLIVAIPRFYVALAPLWESPERSYEEKMRGAWGPYFDFMQFVQAQTPGNAVLLFDPKYYYATVNLYFLYPRKLLYGGAEALRSHPEIDYVVISEGFPDFSVTGEKTMFDDKQGLFRILK